MPSPRFLRKRLSRLPRDFYTRPKYGLRLLKHISQLGQYKSCFHVPVWYDAMKKAPPPAQPRYTTLPKYSPFEKTTNDSWKERAIRASKFIKSLQSHGVNPIPWWWEKRPIDTALEEIGALMRNNNWTPEKAAAEWDKLFGAKQLVTRFEMQMIRENAEKESKGVTVLQTFQVLQLLKDMETESQEKVTYREQKGFDEDEHGQEIYEGLVLSKPLLDMERVKLRNLNLHLRLHITKLRKMVTALDLYRRALDITDIRSRYVKIKGYTAGQETLPYREVVRTFVYAFEIDKVSATSPLWNKVGFAKERQQMEPEVADLLKRKYNEWKIKFLEFASLGEIKPINVGAVLANIDLGFEQSPFGTKGEHDIIDEYQLLKKPANLSRFVIEYEAVKHYKKLLDNRQKLEEMIDLAKLCKLIDPASLRTMAPRFLEANTLEISAPVEMEAIQKRKEKTKEEEKMKEEAIISLFRDSHSIDIDEF